MSRRLGFYETCCKVNYELLGGDSQVMTVAKVSGELSRETLRKALWILQRRHPFLQAQERIDEQGHDYFSMTFFQALDEEDQLNAVPLQSLERVDDRMWQDVTRHFVSQWIENHSKYHWHVVHLDGGTVHDLLMFTRHELTDGTSSIYLLHDLVHLCGDSPGHQDTAAHALHQKLPFQPAIETLLPLPEDPKPKNEPQIELVPWAYESFAPLEAREVNLVFQSLDEDLMERLKMQTKLQGVTINSALSSAYFQAEYELFQKGDEIGLLYKSAISLRKYCIPPLGNEHLGTFVMMIPTVHLMRQNRDFWALAQEVGALLKQGIAQAEVTGFLPISFQKALVEQAIRDGYKQSCAHQSFADGPWISNLGVVPFERNHGNLVLDELYFGSKQTAGDSGPVLSLVTFQGRLFFSFSACEPLISKTTLEKLADLFVAKLAANC